MDVLAAIKLLDPVMIGQVRHDVIHLRTPCYSDFMRLGDPRRPSYVGVTLVWQIDHATIGAYVNTLVSEADAEILINLSMDDALRLQSAVLSFFEGCGDTNAMRRLFRDLAFGLEQPLRGVLDLSLDELAYCHHEAGVYQRDKKKS